MTNPSNAMPAAGDRRGWVRASVLAVGSLAMIAVSGAGLSRATAAEGDEPLPSKEITIKTTDGLALMATYYPSRLEKDAVPVILLHAAKGTRGDFEPLAKMLQRAGNAVIAPDLRGHGDSVAGRATDRGRDLRPADLVAMVELDVEAVKNFLMQRNNDGELNIDKLCIVGVEMGSVVALNFAARDWSWPVLANGKQGQDVKALVLISPEWSYKGLRINDAVAQPEIRSGMSVMIIAGKGSARLLQEARRLHSALEKYRPAAPPESVADKQTLWLRTPPTSLQGTRLLNEKSMLVDKMIAKFIELRLVDVAIPWSERKNSLE